MCTIGRGGLGCLAITLAVLHASPGLTDDMEPICRVLYAEAAGQPIAGKVGVVEVITNRMRATGRSAEQIVNAKGQFEPVMRAGGQWRNLRPLSPSEQSECNTILQLKAGGWLADVAPGADHFQNPRIVAERTRDDAVKPSIVDFGGMHVVRAIGDHRFYRSGGTATPKPERRGMASMFAGQTEADEFDTQIIADDTP